MILDDDQSIYSFRGSNISAVMYAKTVLGAKEHVLEENYRSSKSIVKASRVLINNNSGKIVKNIYTNNKDGVQPVYFKVSNKKSEDENIANIINTMIDKKGYSYKDIAILSRTSSYFRTTEEALIKCSIPYEICGGINFAARKEIKDILAYLRFADNTRDLAALERAINVPKRGIGNATFKKIIERIDNSGIINADWIFNEEYPKAIQNKLTPFVKSIQQIQQLSLQNPGIAIRYVLEDTGYHEELKKDEDYIERLANIEVLIAIAEKYENMQEFLFNISLNAEDGTEKTEGKVSLMTLHASKGLEFPVVIICGFYESNMPHFKSMQDDKGVEEERRLAYVGMTRAEEVLFLTSPAVISINGRQTNCMNSRFLSEIKDEIRIVDMSF